MPEENTKLKFYNVRHQTKFPFAIYTDFEALTVPITRTNTREEPKNCYQKHVPISVGIKLVSNVVGVLDNEPYETYTNDDVVVWFLNRLLNYREIIFTYLFDDQRLVMTDANQADFDSAFQCYICRKPFPVYGEKFRKGQTKVRDHDHLSGAYRGAAHSLCNL